MFYEKIKQSYKNIFNRVGIGHLTYMTFSSGGSFSKFSHEFQTITGAGEDTIYIDENKGFAINKEVFTDENIQDLGLDKNNLVEKRAIEVGNIFSLGTKFTEPFNLKYKNENGEEKLVVMGSYGIGLSRLMGAIVEVSNDERGIIWPESVAPFKVHLLVIGNDEDSKKEAENLYLEFKNKNIEVLFDDRINLTAGEKFADSDLIGIPYRVLVSKRSLADGGYELKERKSVDSSRILTKESLFDLLK